MDKRRFVSVALCLALVASSGAFPVAAAALETEASDEGQVSSIEDAATEGVSEPETGDASVQDDEADASLDQTVPEDAVEESDGLRQEGSAPSTAPTDSSDPAQLTEEQVVEETEPQDEISAESLDVEPRAVTLRAGSVSGWSRVYGQDQLDTMEAISKKGWSSSNTVVIATDATFWDALSANSLAGALGCPVLLTHKNSLSSQTKREIQRLGAKKAYVVGGPIAIASGVDDQIKAAGCSDVTRVFGQDQQGTSLEIAKLVMQLRPSSSVIVATSRTFQDALSIAPYSYSKGAPVLICQSGTNKLTDSQLSFIGSKKFSSALIVGGPIAVSSSVESQIRSKGVSNVERQYGQTEYETSVAIAKWELSHGMGLSAPGIATGVTFYDALTGAGLCGMNNSVLLIASSYNRVALTDFVSQYRGQMTAGYVFGGEIAVSASVYETLTYCFQNGYSDSYATSEEKPYSAVYNYEYYRKANPDVANAYGNNRTATLNHFLTFGMKERRQGCSGFSVQSYYNQYVDLRKAYGTNWPSYYQHYINYGKSEGRAGTGCGSLQGGWQYHNIAWAGQPNSYYCGPTVGFMILRNVGAGNSKYNGAGLTINNVANHMETDRYGYTSFNNRKFQQGMNRWLGSDIYATAELPSYATVRQEVLDSYRNGYATAFDAHERRGGPHYNGHGNSTFSHIVVVDAYNQDTDVATIVDCSSSWYSHSSQKFNYDLSDFVGRFVNAPDWGYRDGIGMYYAKN